ncbi:hypothetical protein OIE66_05755 [Nonomuraea sp. NBC_01738]|nr:hypothetical protein OIE66_05755 [Nonomuraea sp. NBC_01738]
MRRFLVILGTIAVIVTGFAASASADMDPPNPPCPYPKEFCDDDTYWT